MTSGLRKQRRYSAKASSENRLGRAADREGRMHAPMWRRKNSGSAPMSRSGKPGAGRGSTSGIPPSPRGGRRSRTVRRWARCRGPRACGPAPRGRAPCDRPAPPAVVAGHEERREAEPLHHRYLVGGHRALAVGPVVLGIGRVRAVPVAAEVRRDHGEVLGEARGDPVPHDLVLRIAVEEQEWRPGPSSHQIDLPPRRSGCARA